MSRRWRIYESYASLLIQAMDQRRLKKPFSLRSTSARFQLRRFFPLSANLRKIQFMVFLTRTDVQTVIVFLRNAKEVRIIVVVHAPLVVKRYETAP